MLVPIASVQEPAGSPEDAHNYFQSFARMHVEKAFGPQLSKRLALRSRLGVSLRNTIKLNEWTMALHNFFKDGNDVEFGQFLSVTEQKEADDRWSI